MTRRLPGYSSGALIERLRNAKPVPRTNNQPPVAFTKDEVLAILDARARRITWPEINSMLPIPYTVARNLNTAVFRSARTYGIDPIEYIYQNEPSDE
jgi:hypothetical protein